LCSLQCLRFIAAIRLEVTSYAFTKFLFLQLFIKAFSASQFLPINSVFFEEDLA